MSRLILIDGHAIIHRAYHALPPLTTPYGQQANAVYGFVSILLRVIDELKPTHIAICFDLPTATFRHEAYIAYQSQRPTLDQELKDQIELVKETVESTGIPMYASPGFEADDVIGTLSTQAVDLGIDEVVIVTGDRDIMQLVNDKIKVYAPIKGISNAVLMGEKEVEEYIGVKPSKIIDYKALIGDSSDNYPGVPGIGPKTAQNLLNLYSTVEDLYQAIEKEDAKAIPASVLAKLNTGKDSAFLSKHLATIAKHAPVGLKFEKAKVEPLRENKIFINKLKELGFKSLLARLGGQVGQTNLETSNKKSERKDQLELI